jgi:hypothetical protein
MRHPVLKPQVPLAMRIITLPVPKVIGTFHSPRQAKGGMGKRKSTRDHKKGGSVKGMRYKSNDKDVKDKKYLS